MGKYTFLGVILAISLFLITSVMINHSSNTSTMQAIDTGIKTAVLGNMRNDESTTQYGMRAKDVVTVITQEVTKNQSDYKKTATIDFKFFEDENGNIPIEYSKAIADNSIIKSVQYKVDLYNSKDVTTNASGETVIKGGAVAESSTENRIILNKTI